MQSKNHLLLSLHLRGLLYSSQSKSRTKEHILPLLVQYLFDRSLVAMEDRDVGANADEDDAAATLHTEQIVSKVQHLHLQHGMDYIQLVLEVFVIKQE